MPLYLTTTTPSTVQTTTEPPVSIIPSTIRLTGELNFNRNELREKLLGEYNLIGGYDLESYKNGLQYEHEFSTEFSHGISYMIYDNNKWSVVSYEVLNEDRLYRRGLRRGRLRSGLYLSRLQRRRLHRRSVYRHIQFRSDFTRWLWKETTG